MNATQLLDPSRTQAVQIEFSLRYSGARFGVPGHKRHGALLFPQSHVATRISSNLLSVRHLLSNNPIRYGVCTSHPVFAGRHGITAWVFGVLLDDSSSPYGVDLFLVNFLMLFFVSVLLFSVERSAVGVMNLMKNEQKSRIPIGGRKSDDLDGMVGRSGPHFGINVSGLSVLLDLYCLSISL